jgi:asparagine synthase (glutamine-hydrolysing)
MRDAMGHRGPDGKGEWRSACERVALGHRRLAVIDLSPDSAQPLTSHDGAYTIAFNGEIYNYRELREALIKRGHHFNSRGDTEVILESYRAWGRGCLEQLNGMFAFALYDASKGGVLLARDRAGEKPLYYRWAGERLVFASELKSMLLMPDASTTVDLPAFNYYLAYGYTPPDQSMLSGYRKLRPAHSIWVDLESGRQDEKQMAAARRANDLDLQFYEYVCKVTYPAQKAAYGDNLESDVAAFQANRVPAGFFWNRVLGEAKRRLVYQPWSRICARIH